MQQVFGQGQKIELKAQALEVALQDRSEEQVEQEQEQAKVQDGFPGRMVSACRPLVLLLL